MNNIILVSREWFDKVKYWKSDNLFLQMIIQTVEIAFITYGIWICFCSISAPHVIFRLSKGFSKFFKLSKGFRKEHGSVFPNS